jgi:hypothetical protein
MVRTVAACVLTVGFVGLAAVTGAQTTTATIQGVVRDTSEAVLPGVAISVRSPDTGLTRTAITQADGRFYVASLPIGRYDVTAELTGFQGQTQSGVRLEVGQEATLDFTLAVAGVREVVTVTAASSGVETTRTTISRVVRREQLDLLPISGRTAANLALLAPGVVPQSALGEPVTGGAQPRGSIEILVDGVSNKGITLGNVRSNAPPDAVEEFGVLTGQYSAEFGNASGLVLNTITRSGTNRLQGRIYYFHRDEALDARNAFATTKTAFELKQGGGWLGGPILVDRTHFFGSAEITRGVAVATVNTDVEQGGVKQPFRNENAFLKITHQLTPRNGLMARILVDRPVRENEGVGGAYLASRGYDLVKRDRAFVSALSTVFSTRAQNELRVQYSSFFLEARVADPNAYTIIRPGLYAGKAANLPRGGTERRMQAVDTVSYHAGHHHLKVGFDISRITGSSYWWLNVPGTLTFTTVRPFDPNDVTTYPAQFTRTEGGITYSDVTTANVSAFAQDRWDIHSTLTLNAGLRYDAYSMTGLDLQKVNFAPRLGLAWNPQGNGDTVVRGGFAVSYNSILSNIADVTGELGSRDRIVIKNPGYPDPFSQGRYSQGASNRVRAQDNMVVPRSYNTTVGVQREIRAGLIVNVDYVNIKGRHLIRQVETNPTPPPTWKRQDPTLGYRREERSNGYSNYQAMWIGVRRRWGGRFEVGGSYTLASGKSTQEIESVFVQQDDRNPDDAYGYTSNDERHRLAVNGSFSLPWGVRVAAVLYARSGRPVDVTTGYDDNQNSSYLDRPNLAPGVRLGTDAMRRTGAYNYTAGTLGNLPRNAGRGPGFWQINARVSKVIRLGKAKAEVLAEAFNVDNHVNLDNWVSNLKSYDWFGKSVSANTRRQVQLGLRVDF